MDYKSISPGELSNILEVQRSNISHILNGRNMPGATFIEKLLVCFPDLNARWLLTGTGEMTSSDIEIVKEPDVISQKEIVKPVIRKQKSDIIYKSEKSISKVVVLFDDGTFIDYNKKENR
jgi:hypothetical protein